MFLKLGRGCLRNLSNGAGFSESTSLAENKFRYELFKNQLLFPEFVLSPSVYLKRRYESEGFREITVLPLGLNATGKAEKLPFNGTLRIGYLGNIERHKGLLLMLEEMGKIRELDHIEIDIYGKPKDPVYHAEVKKLAKRSLRGKVAFHGTYRSGADLKAILAKMHLMVFPSLWEENYPLVIREALLQGVPVVASNIGGVPEAIKDGVNGFLFNPYEEGALAGRISYILSNPQILESITEGARNTEVESMEQHVAKVGDLYQRAFENRRDRATASTFAP